VRCSLCAIGGTVETWLVKIFPSKPGLARWPEDYLRKPQIWVAVAIEKVMESVTSVPVIFADI
jgi:hypothetical protein